MDIALAKELIAGHLAVPVELVTEGARFGQDLGADSLDQVSLTMLLEEEFDIAITDAETERCATVGDALALLRVKRFFNHRQRAEPQASAAMW